MLRTVLLAIFALVSLNTKSAIADFKLDLARRLNIIDAQWLIINLPPRPACLPGTIFSSDFRINILPNTSKSGFERGPEFSFASAIDVEGSGGGGISGIALPFELAAEAKSFASASLTISRAHVLEIAAPGIRNVLKKLTPRLRNSTPPPAMIQRAYEGYFTLTLTKKNEADTSLMADLYRRVVSAGVKASFSENKTISFESNEPVVFAFEVARLTDLGRIANSAKSMNDVIAGKITPGTVGSTAGSLQTAGVPSASPGRVVLEPDGLARGGTASVGTLETEERILNLPAGALTGLERIPAVDFEQTNPASMLRIR